MHELSIATELLDRVEAVIPDADAVRVTGVTIMVGALSGVDPGSLELAIPSAFRGSRAEGCRVELIPVAAETRCTACEAVNSCEPPFFICTGCGSGDVEVLKGRELVLKSVEFEDGSDDVANIDPPGRERNQ